MSGPEGTPNGVDRLAQIVQQYAAAKGITESQAREEVERALVEIARAANDLRSGAVGYRDGVSVSRERYVALTSALARLDSEEAK